MTKEMVDAIEEYSRLKYHDSSDIESKKALLVIHNAIWKIKLQMEGKINGN